MEKIFYGIYGVGEVSPIFCKDAMKTFERYFIEDKKMHKEEKNSYYKYIDNEEKPFKKINFY